MSWFRLLISMLTATLLVLGALAAGLHFYYKPQPPAGAAERALEIHYLTPEEAAALLGGEPGRFGTPPTVTAPPGDPAGTDPQQRR